MEIKVKSTAAETLEVAGFEKEGYMYDRYNKRHDVWSRRGTFYHVTVDITAEGKVLRLKDVTSLDLSFSQRKKR